MSLPARVKRQMTISTNYRSDEVEPSTPPRDWKKQITKKIEELKQCEKQKNEKIEEFENCEEQKNECIREKSVATSNLRKEKELVQLLKTELDTYQEYDAVLKDIYNKITGSDIYEFDKNLFPTLKSKLDQIVSEKATKTNQINELTAELESCKIENDLLKDNMSRINLINIECSEQLKLEQTKSENIASDKLDELISEKTKNQTLTQSIQKIEQKLLETNTALKECQDAKNKTKTEELKKLQIELNGLNAQNIELEKNINQLKEQLKNCKSTEDNTRVVVVDDINEDDINEDENIENNNGGGLINSISNAIFPKQDYNKDCDDQIAKIKEDNNSEYIKLNTEYKQALSQKTELEAKILNLQLQIDEVSKSLTSCQESNTKISQKLKECEEKKCPDNVCPECKCPEQQQVVCPECAEIDEIGQVVVDFVKSKLEPKLLVLLNPRPNKKSFKEAADGVILQDNSAVQKMLKQLYSELENLQ